MNEKLLFGMGCRIKTEPSDEDLTLSELEDKIFEITKKQNMLTHWGLSKEVEALAIKELHEQKAKLKEIMIRKINEL